MKRFLIILSAILLFASCDPCRRCMQSSHSTDSVSRTHISHDLRYHYSFIRTMEQPLPFERSNDISPDTARAETSLAFAKAWFDGLNIWLEMWNKPTTQLPYRFDGVYASKSDSVNNEHKSVEVKIIEVNKLKPWQKIFIGGGFGLLAIIIIAVVLFVWRIFKPP